MHLYLPDSVSRIWSVDDACHNVAGNQSNVKELLFVRWWQSISDLRRVNCDVHPGVVVVMENIERDISNNHILW